MVSTDIVFAVGRNSLLHGEYNKKKGLTIRKNKGKGVRREKSEREEILTILPRSGCE